MKPARKFRQSAGEERAACREESFAEKSEEMLPFKSGAEYWSAQVHYACMWKKYSRLEKDQ